MNLETFATAEEYSSFLDKEAEGFVISVKFAWFDKSQLTSSNLRQTHIP